MPSTDHEDTFLDEVLGLFILEAQEWIHQSHTALRELEHHPVLERKQKLYETIVCGITNLGGSAATVELPDLEKLAFGLLPLLQTMQTLNGSTTALQLNALREGFNGIIAAVQTLNSTKTGRIPNLDELLKRVAEVTEQSAAVPHDDDPGVAFPAADSTSAPPLSPGVMERLVEFSRRQAGTAPSARHTVDAVIRRAKSDYGERGWRLLNAPTVLEIIEELDRSDRQFVNDVRKRLPTVTGIFADCSSPHAEMLLSNGRLDRLLQEVQALHDSARMYEAKPLMQFFHGVHSFLLILSQKTVPIAASRIEAVESRLNRMVPTVEQWIEVGKNERASIEQMIRQ